MRRITLALALCSACTAPRPAPRAAGAPPLAMGVDLHAHPTMAFAARPVFRGLPYAGPDARGPDDVTHNQLEAAALRRAGVTVVLAAVWPPPALDPGTSALEEALRQLVLLRRWAASTPDFRVAGDASAARGLALTGKIALIPAVEGGEGVEAPEDVDRLFAAGARVMQPVHMVDDDLGGAADGQLGGLVGLHARSRDGHGLTPLGKAAVARMFRLGMLLDLAHMSDAAAEDALALAETAHAPVLFTHGGARSLNPLERNVTDEVARRVAASGGLVGVTLYRRFLAGVPAADRWPGYAPGTCDDVVAAWLHLARVAGPEAVALGSDFNGFVARPRPGGSCPDGLSDSGDLSELYAALEAKGIPRAALDGGGRRLLSALELAERRADPDARAGALALDEP